MNTAAFNILFTFQSTPFNRHHLIHLNHFSTIENRCYIWPMEHNIESTPGTPRGIQ